MRLILCVGVAAVLVFPGRPAPAQEKDSPEQKAVAAGINFLLDSQHGDGSWGQQITFAKGGMINGTTAIGILALKAHAQVNKEKISATVDRAQKYLLGLKTIQGVQVSGMNGDMSYWNYAFILIAQLQAHKEKPSPELKQQIETCIKAMEEGQVKGSGGEAGSWRYFLSGVTTLTATCLISLIEAKEAGFTVSEETIKRATEAMKRARTPAGTFHYLHVPSKQDAAQFSSKLGSSARNVSNELVLYMAGESDKAKLKWAVENFFHHRQELERTRQKGSTLNSPSVKHHVGRDLTAAYYCLYGHFFALQILHLLDKDTHLEIDPKDKTQTRTPAEAIEMIKKAVVEIQRKDGSWIDSGLVGPYYGTGMALWILTGKQWIGKKE